MCSFTACIVHTPSLFLPRLVECIVPTLSLSLVLFCTLLLDPPAHPERDRLLHLLLDALRPRHARVGRRHRLLRLLAQRLRQHGRRPLRRRLLPLRTVRPLLRESLARVLLTQQPCLQADH